MVAIDHFIFDDFLGSVADGIHGTHPNHLVAGFHGFGHALGFLHLLDDAVAPFCCLFIQVGKDGVQSAGQDKTEYSAGR